MAVRIAVSNHSRCPEGAPIVVFTPTGFQGNGIAERVTGLDGEGFIEIHLNFTGSGIGTNQGGGKPYDNRNPESLKTARDVLKFAFGALNDFQDRSIAEIVDSVSPLPDNIVLIGWPNGSNTKLCLTGIHGREILRPFWIVDGESTVKDFVPQDETES